MVKILFTQLKLYLMLLTISIFMAGCSPQDSPFIGEGIPAHEFLSIQPWTSKDKVIKRFGHPIATSESRNGKVEHLEYLVGVDKSYSGGEVWGQCAVVVRDGVVVGLEFSGSTEVVPLD